MNQRNRYALPPSTIYRNVDTGSMFHICKYLRARGHEIFYDKDSTDWYFDMKDNPYWEEVKYCPQCGVHLSKLSLRK